MNTVSILHPGALWLLILLALLPLALSGSLAPMAPWQRRTSLGVRALLLACLVLALSGVRFPRESRRLAVAFLLDRSASVAPEAEQAGRAYLRAALAGRRAGDEATVLGFAKNVAVLKLDEVRSDAPLPLQPDRDATDIGKALAHAAAVFPEGCVKRLVLLSDGRDTAGRASEAVQALRTSGVELDTVPLRNPFRPEALVERLEIPAVLREGEPFDAVAVVQSNVEMGCSVRLFAGGFVAATQTVRLKPGGNPVLFRNLRPEKGRSVYLVEISPEQDTVAENNRARATATQRGQASVLIVDPAPDKMQPLAGALKAAHIDAQVRPPEGLPSTMEDLQAFDALILSDVSAVQPGGGVASLTGDRMRLYLQWVRDFGGGLVMLGGDKSFGLGGFAGTPLEKLLPVRMDHNDVAESPVVAVTIVLDSSGSMSAQVAGQTKMSLANQGAALALDVLQPKDLLGVMAVDTQVHQVAALTRHDDRGEVAARIRKVTAGGGGIYVYTSLLDAFAQLRDAAAKIKHVILFCDAADAEEKAAGERPEGSQVPGNALDLVSSMTGDRITTSVVGLGGPGDKDVPFLKQLASNGGGQFYLTDDALSLPQIFVAETMRVAQSSLLEEPFVVQQVHPAPVLEGIEWDKAPPLGGCNLTKLKDGADLLLANGRGHPLLAVWRYGAGQVAAFTSDAKSRWAGDWLPWPGYGKFWAQLTRSLIHSGDRSGLHVQAVPENGALRLRIDAIAPDGAFRNGLPLTVAALDTTGSGRSAAARQVAPGRYIADLPVPTAGIEWFSVKATPEEPGVLLGYAPPYPAEYLASDTNEPSLRRWAEMAGGRFSPDSRDVFARPRAPALRTLDLTAPFLILALLLLPLDIWLRRREG